MLQLKTYVGRNDAVIKNDCALRGIPYPQDRDHYPELQYVALDDPDFINRLGADKEQPFFLMYLEMIHNGTVVMDSRHAGLELWADLTSVLYQWQTRGAGEVLQGNGPHYLSLKTLDSGSLLLQIGSPTKVDPSLVHLLKSLQAEAESDATPSPTLPPQFQDEEALRHFLFPKREPLLHYIFPQDEWVRAVTEAGIHYFQRMLDAGFYADGYGEASLRSLYAVKGGASAAP
ncbi:hypothetical protein [Paenibacillus turpanensis]|uniref:hypothetical protein n=1 Tax=Paenibacillus turpanensis TaxID=2689078 RepID=UPI00140E524C|nr:hypothetical protein [Paenibacillus turpanensis]